MMGAGDCRCRVLSSRLQHLGFPSPGVLVVSADNCCCDPMNFGDWTTLATGSTSRRSISRTVMSRLGYLENRYLVPKASASFPSRMRNLASKAGMLNMLITRPWTVVRRPYERSEVKDKYFQHL